VLPGTQVMWYPLVQQGVSWGVAVEEISTVDGNTLGSTSITLIDGFMPGLVFKEDIYRAYIDYLQLQSGPN